MRKLFFKIFKFYRRLELKQFSWREADRVLKENEGKSENQRWKIAPEEDNNVVNIMNPTVWLERRERITE